MMIYFKIGRNRYRALFSFMGLAKILIFLLLFLKFNAQFQDKSFQLKSSSVSYQLRLNFISCILILTLCLKNLGQWNMIFQCLLQKNAFYNLLFGRVHSRYLLFCSFINNRNPWCVRKITLISAIKVISKKGY